MSAPIDLNLLRAFAAVHETGSFSAAGQRLGLPRSTVSRAVAALEEALGIELFSRTTRHVTTTTAGVELYDRVAPSLVHLDATLADLPVREAVCGTVRVTSTQDIGAAVLAEAAARFTARHPQANVDLLVTAKLLDLQRDGVDLALRIAMGQQLPDSSLLASKIGRIALQLYAAPGYLARRGAPKSPDDLEGHDWLGFEGAFAAPPGAPAPRVTCEDPFVLREVIRAGAGIGPVPTLLAEPDVAAGLLQRVLPEWVAFTGTVYLVQPARKHVPATVTAFREVLDEVLRYHPLSRAGAVS